MGELGLKCPNCGSEISLGTQYCGQCGGRLFEYERQSSTPTQYPGYSPTNYTCQYCHSQLWWSDQYQNYYCSQCKKYIPATQDSIDRAIGSIKKEFNK